MRRIDSEADEPGAVSLKDLTDDSHSQVRAGLDPASPVRRLVFVWVGLLISLFAAFPYAALTGFQGTEAYFLLHQDLPVAALCVAMTAFVGRVDTGWLLQWGARLGPPSAGKVLALALLCGIAGVLGMWLAFGGYTLSLDEFMANFDARIFAHGQLMAPVDDAWQPFIAALQPMFLLPVPDNDLWVSCYLPVNAAMRALGEVAHCDWLVNPLLTAFSVVAVWGVARRLWPERPSLALGAAALLASSAQLVVMSMTAYAMPGHLAFNLAWLWLFLRGGRLGHAGALVIGFLATGLHQLAFHPMFAAPFVLQLWLDRRWRLAGLYTLAYAAIGLFWIEYWSIEMRLMGEAAEDARQLGGGWFIERAGEVLSSAMNFGALGAMSESLFRFVTWQNPLTAPLTVLGGVAAFRAKGHMRALALGVLLTILAMLVLEPTQTHGWGYRYLHGLLGSCCLLAVWTWTELTDAIAPSRRAAAQGAFALTCVLSMLVLTPLRTWQAWRYVRPYAAASAQIQAAKAQVVIVDHEGTPGFDAGTVVRNDPYLQQGPKVMELSYMDAGMVRQVCSHYSVQVFTAHDAARAGIDTVNLITEPRVARLRALMKQLNCGRPTP
jgi:hypothetical protein